MGVLICRKHGYGLLFGCPHVGAAVRAGSPCDGIQYLTYPATADPEFAEIEWAGWFCPQCIDDYHLPPDGTILSDAFGFMEDKDDLYRPMCPGCFRDWQARSSVQLIDTDSAGTPTHPEEPS